MMIKITPNYENRKVYLQIKNTEELTKSAIRQAFHLIGSDLIKFSAKFIDKQPKSGRLYRIKVNGMMILHRASAPNEAPAVLTGRLKRSLDYTISGSERMEFGSRRNTEFSGIANYPKYLEEGTTKMGRRPFLEPAIKESERNVRMYFNEQLKRALKK